MFVEEVIALDELIAVAITAVPPDCCEVRAPGPPLRRKPKFPITASQLFPVLPPTFPVTPAAAAPIVKTNVCWPTGLVAALARFIRAAASAPVHEGKPVLAEPYALPLPPPPIPNNHKNLASGGILIVTVRAPARLTGACTRMGVE